MSFTLSNLAESTTGWGPSTIPEEFRHVYAPFSKSDKLGKAADWTSTNHTHNRRDRHNASGSNTVFDYHVSELEPDFQTVEQRSGGKRASRTRLGAGQQSNWNRQWRRWGDNRNNRDNNQGGWGASGWANEKSQGERARSAAVHRPNRRGKAAAVAQARRYWHPSQRYVMRDASIDVADSWEMRYEFSFPSLVRLTHSASDAEDLHTAGLAKVFHKAMDRVTTRAPMRLDRTARTFNHPTASKDPVLQKLASEDAGNVFVTDTVLATIMAGPRSNFSWDIVVTKKDDAIWLDARDPTNFERLTVSENAAEGPTEDDVVINTPSSLSQEATFISQSYAHQSLVHSADNEDALKFDNEAPFAPVTAGPDDDTPEQSMSFAYRYRRWTLTDTDITLVVRTQVDAVVPKGGGGGTGGGAAGGGMGGQAGLTSLTTASGVAPGETDERPTYVAIRALNEYKPTPEIAWKRHLDSQRGAVLANELKNNSNKLAKWTMQALLAGVDQLKLGFVSRANAKDNLSHVIVGTQTFRPRDFATQINMSPANAWGVVREILSTLFRQDDGKYLLLKDPQKAVLRLYSVPADAFDKPAASEQSNAAAETEANEEDSDSD